MKKKKAQNEKTVTAARPVQKSVSNFDPGFVASLVAASIFFAIFFGICVYKYNNLQFHDWDLSLHANGMWNLVHGRHLISISNFPFLGSHFTVIAFVIAPIFFIFQSALTLLFLQIAALSAVAVIIYLIARRKFNWPESLAFALIYLAYPSLIYVALYEFHFEAISPLFLTAMFYFLLIKKRLYFFISAILAMLCKENIPLVVAAIGAYGFIFRPNRRMMGLAACVLGIAYFFLVTLKLQPLAAGTLGAEGGGGYSFLYSKYGEGFGNIYLYMLTHPLDILRDLFSTGTRMDFFLKTFSPIMFLSLLRPDILLITAPTILKNLLSEVTTNHEIYWHYTATIIPFVVISMIFGFKNLMRFRVAKKILPFVLIFLFVNELALSYSYFHGANLFFFAPTSVTNNDLAKKDALRLIPNKSSVIATFDFLPKLSMRKDVYSFYPVWRKFSPLPENILFAIADFNDYFVRKDLRWTADNIVPLFSRFLTPEWNVKYAKGDVVVFEKVGKNGKNVVTLINENDPLYQKHSAKVFMTVNDSLELTDYSCTLLEKEGTMHITFYWKIKQPTAKLYEIYFLVSGWNMTEVITNHGLCYWYNLAQLPANTMIKEDYWLILPKNSPGTYSIWADVVDLLEMKKAGMVFSDKSVTNDQNFLLIGQYENRNQ